tara:strand:- start:325795 stop:325965 length:171 start_codon:yes stop_codon:yes gene_type:complete
MTGNNQNRLSVRKIPSDFFYHEKYETTRNEKQGVGLDVIRAERSEQEIVSSCDHFM